MKRLPAWAFTLGILLLVAGTGALSTSVYRFTRQLALDTGATGLDVPDVEELFAMGIGRPSAIPPTIEIPETSAPAPSPTIAVSSPAATPVPIVIRETEERTTTTPLAGWEDPRRITILLMGIDERSGVDAIASPNTDSMMLVTIDPAGKRAAVLSLPRDLWVAIPSFPNNRINTAYKIGATSNYPGGGPQLAMDTVALNLGIEVNYYLRVNFVAFEQLVDSLFPRGVEICVEEEIHDPDYPDIGYGTIDVRFSVGCQRLDGQRLLQYARTRATNDGDFGRSGRQQQVLRAMQDELFTPGGIVNLVRRLPILMSQLAANFDTNLSTDEIRALLTLAGELEAANVRYEVIDHRYVEFATTPNNEQVLLPRQGALSGLVADLLNARETVSLAELRAQAAEEQKTVAIWNGAGVPGLAAEVGEFLEQQGLRVVEIGNAAQRQQRTFIETADSAPATARLISALFGWDDRRLTPQTNAAGASVLVLLGADMPEALASARQQAAE